LTPLTFALLIVFITTAVLAIGLSTTLAGALAALRERRLFARVILANFVLVPLVGVALVRVFPLSGDAAIALLLLASAAGGPNAIQFTSKVSDELDLAAAVLFLLTLVSVVVTPVLVLLTLPVEEPITVPYLRVLGALGGLMLLPLFLGSAVRQRAPTQAAKLAKPLMTLSSLAFVASVVAAASSRQDAAQAVRGSTLAAMLVLTLVSMAIGWWLGGPSQGSRRVLAVATNMRHVPLTVAISIASFPSRDVDIALLAYLLVVAPPNLVFTIYHGIKAKH